MKKIITALAAILILGACAAAQPVLIDARPPLAAEPFTGPEIGVIAHRCNGGPFTENTLDECVVALAAGATYLETDVRWTETGTLVLLHDPHLGLFGRSDIEISTVSFTAAAKYVSSSHNNLTLLTQFRDLVQFSGVRAIVEPKVVPSAEQWIALDSRLRVVKNRVVISSFDRSVVSEAIRRGYSGALNTYADVTSPPAGTDMVVQRASDIDAATVATLRSKGIDVACFSCDTATSWADMKVKGVTFFITYDHVAAQQWVDTH
jgi:glycerophosphoryl diester phosphodiesterase